MKKLIPNLLIYNGKKASSLETDRSTDLKATTDLGSKDSNNVIRIIRREWEKEVERIKNLYSEGVDNSKCKKTNER